MKRFWSAISPHSIFNLFKYVCENKLIVWFSNVCLQRLIISIISSPDEDGDISLKDTQSLVTVIALLAQHLEPDGQQVISFNKYCLHIILQGSKWRLVNGQRPVTHTLILEQTLKSSPVNVRFCLFVQIHSRLLIENYTRFSQHFFSQYFDWSETRLDSENFFCRSLCPATVRKLFLALFWLLCLVLCTLLYPYIIKRIFYPFSVLLLFRSLFSAFFSSRLSFSRSGCLLPVSRFIANLYIFCS